LPKIFCTHQFKRLLLSLVLRQLKSSPEHQGNKEKPRITFNSDRDASNCKPNIIGNFERKIEVYFGKGSRAIYQAFLALVREQSLPHNPNTQLLRLLVPILLVDFVIWWCSPPKTPLNVR
jgi:hypothetical protein